MTLRRRVQAVPSNNNGARPLIRVEPKQEIGEAEDSARALAIAAANGFRQRVVRSMGEGVAVDDSNGGREGLGSLTARVWLLTSPFVRRADFLAFDDDGAAVVASLPTRLAENG